MQPTADESKSTPAEPLPEQIGRYRILGRLGAGGMGTVYKAHDPQLDRVVALKLPRFDGSPHDRTMRIQRFQREARAAAQIFHPHVCPIFDVGECDRQPYVVMAYVEGQSLAERLASERRLEDVTQAVLIIRQILDALEAVHARGIIHRDLKPGNIMLDQAGRAILTDFGLARPENDAEHLTSDGVIIGTPAYMAPEQAAGQSERIGPWTDLYSVGVVLYELLTGQVPFTGTPLTVLHRIVHETPLRVAALRMDIDAELEAVVRKGLAKDPAQRYQTGREFGDALTAWSAVANARNCGTSLVAPAARGDENGLTVQGPIATIGGRRKARPLLTWTRWMLAALGIGIALILFTMVVALLTGIISSALGLTLYAGAVILVSLAFFHEMRRNRHLAFLKAAAEGKEGQVKNLLCQGLPVNARDPAGETALMKAAANGHSPVVHVLLVSGANIHATNRFGQTALMMATVKGHSDVAQQLRKAGATG